MAVKAASKLTLLLTDLVEHHSAGMAGESMPTVWAALRNCCAKLPFLLSEVVFISRVR